MWFENAFVINHFAKDALSMRWSTHSSFLTVGFISDIGGCVLTGVIWCCACPYYNSYIIWSVGRQKVKGYTENALRCLCNMWSSCRIQIQIHLYNIPLYYFSDQLLKVHNDSTSRAWITVVCACSISGFVSWLNFSNKYDHYQYKLWTHYLILSKSIFWIICKHLHK